ncbi:hypothetical protein B0F90DRAFT_1819255 [Multifurca ochricompacta]|uniref:Uncharacterized protein n=1 Tax=Multifurca ochricompacta TaxID=376703 RepID=A0AAD4M0J1_9AGAM|nr:hypothetical protein B0F90DRAFT_1819255 [Multifurca ochricompacta]
MSPQTPTDICKQFLAGLNIFNASSLTTDEDINTAVNVLQDTLDDESIGPIIRCSLSLEPVGHDTAAYISKFILNKFPSNAEGFTTSLGYQILSRLSNCLSGLPYPSGQQPDGLEDHQTHTRMAPAILEYLSTLLLSGVFDKAGTGRRSNKNMVQRFESSRSKSPTGKPRLLAEEMIRSTIDTQKNILKFFITLIRRPEVGRLVRTAYLRENTLQGNPATGATDSPLATSADTIQADLYFESPVGYGKWRIFCPVSCLGDLVLDGAHSDPVIKRLEELSFGCFSETNQKRLTRNSPVDIFRARLPGNMGWLSLENT